LQAYPESNLLNFLVNDDVAGAKEKRQMITSNGVGEAGYG
jgi:hypothetical protein